MRSLRKKTVLYGPLPDICSSFGLGRELSPSDSLVLDEIVERVKEKNYSMKSMIHAVVASKPFRGKNGKLALHNKP